MAQLETEIPENSLHSLHSLAADYEDIESIDSPLSSPLEKEHSVLSAAAIGKTPSGHAFAVPETHDMVRSLFDPTLRKSYGEILIFISLVANFWIYKVLGTQQNRIYGFVFLFGFWRLCYNFGIGALLYNQSKYTSLVQFSKKNNLFQPASQSTIIQKLSVLEVSSKMGPAYKMEEYPVEFNTWLVFRQFVDLILMQDFTTYIFLVYTAGQNSAFAQTPFLNYTRLVLGTLLVGFNLWVKIDAHRVVKDYAWYWGDFFFLQESELIFDGVFNLSPHPMYSIGYIGYYGFALITKSYLVLIVSLSAHALQFVFLTWVEDPHIEKIYGSDSAEIVVEELESSEAYLKPLIVFSNFNPIRLVDYLTVFASVYTIVSPVLVSKGNESWTLGFFGFALVIKLAHAFITGYILRKQSTEKSWTKLYLKYGFDTITAYSNWQTLYNFLLVTSYSSLIGLSIREIISGQYKVGTWLLLRVIIGSLLILLQVWTSSSIIKSIGDFGWFYGDFFLPNFSRKSLTKSGIYRYLNDPERLLGVSGIWGATLITYSPFVFLLAMVWTIHITLLLEFVEKPHMIKVYGEQQVLKNESGVSLTLKQFIPKRLNSTFDSLYINTFNKVDNYIKRRTLSDHLHRKEVVRTLLRRESTSVHRSYTLEILNSQESAIEIGQPIRVKWKAPITHNKRDWIGLYQVLRTGDSRTRTDTSSFGRWVAVTPTAYQRYIGVVEKESKDLDDEGSVTGVIEFNEELLWHEKGVYELRYHHDDSHKVLAISKPFEIVVPSIEVDENLASNLLTLIKRLQPSLASIDTPLNFKQIKPKDISHLVTDATNIDIASEIVVKLKTISNISLRIIKSKEILDQLNRL